MMDCLLDFVDPDDIPRLNGAEAEPGYQPKNALLQRVEELKQVKGWEKFTAQTDWDADFTLYSSGPVDLTSASRDVLLSLPGFNEQIVDAFLQYRRGPDGIDGTADDPVFDSLDQVRLALGFTPDQFAQLSGLIGFKDPVVRVVSVGKSGDATRTIEMIIRKGTRPRSFVGRNSNIEPASESVFITPSGRGWNHGPSPRRQWHLGSAKRRRLERGRRPAPQRR